MAAILSRPQCVKTMRPPQSGHHFAVILQCIFLNDIFCFLNKISLNYDPKGLIQNNPTLVQVMAWC